MGSKIIFMKKSYFAFKGVNALQASIMDVASNRWLTAEPHGVGSGLLQPPLSDQGRPMVYSIVES